MHVEEVKEERPLLCAAVEEDKGLCIGKSWRKRLVKVLSFFHCNIDKTPYSRCMFMIQKYMKESYVQYWRKSLGDEKSNDGKLYLYRRVKLCFGMEPYLKHIRKLKIRRALTAFRISAHNLEIETGRYIHDQTAVGNSGSIKREDRFCTICYEENKSKVMGDEEHAIMHCPRFCDIRNSLLIKIESKVPNFKNLNNNDKLCYMLTCEGECAIFISKFLAVILSTQRSNFLKIWKQQNNPDGRNARRAP